MKETKNRCECCLYYGYDEEFGEECCTLSLDEDEALRYSGKSRSACPYFRWFDEYKSVWKQI